MSAVRAYGPDGKPVWVDQNEVGRPARTSFTRYASRGSSQNPTVIGGMHASGSADAESPKERAARNQREYKARWRASQLGRQSDQRMLDAVVRHGSQTKAADAEGVTVSFVCHALARLVEMGDPVAIKWSKRGRIPHTKQP